MPLGIGHMLALAPDPSVIGTHDNTREFLLGNGLLEDGIKQGPCFPLRAGEDFVIGGPILLGVVVETDGSSHRPFADSAQDAKCQRQGPLQGAVLGEDRGPAGGDLFQ